MTPTTLSPVLILLPWRLDSYMRASVHAAAIIRRAYRRRCLANSLESGVAPHTSTWLADDALDDDKPEQRELGMLAGEAWLAVCSYVVSYEDYGISAGMEREIRAAEALGKSVYRRMIGR